jgi:hypothetical protein
MQNFTRSNIGKPARKQACDNLPRPSLLLIHHSSKDTTSDQQREESNTTTIQPVNMILSLSQNSSPSKNIDNHLMLAYLQEGREKDSK